MRLRDILTGTLLILSIIDLDLAAPVPVQGGIQAHDDEVHIPKNLTTVLEKRWDEELEKLAEGYFKTSGKPIDQSGEHSSSQPDHGPTNVVQPPEPNQASSTTNPDQASMEPSCSPSSSSIQGLSARGNTFRKTCLGLLEDMVDMQSSIRCMGTGQ